MTAPHKPRRTCANVRPGEQRPCGREIGPSGAKGMCPACYRAAHRRRRADESGRQIRPPYRAGEELVAVTLSLPRSLLQRLDAAGGRRERSALVRTVLQQRFPG